MVINMFRAMYYTFSSTHTFEKRGIKLFDKKFYYVYKEYMKGSDLEFLETINCRKLSLHNNIQGILHLHPQVNASDSCFTLIGAHH